MGRYELEIEKLVLRFKKPSGTSRGVLTGKSSYILTVSDKKSGKMGRGECSLIPLVSIDDESKLPDLADTIRLNLETDAPWATGVNLQAFPALAMAMECAFLELANPNRLIADTSFTHGESSIEINGLVWMEAKAEMLRQVEEKVAHGFRCIKIKVGAIGFSEELALLEEIRERWGQQIELRLDANGAFTQDDVVKKLEKLARYDIHSIEQPVRPGQWPLMQELCRYSPIPIALDEELMGLGDHALCRRMLESVQPQYIILKPSLVGGFSAADKWIGLAKETGAGWWATSALESNLGLSHIAQWVSQYGTEIPQGLGTGGLFLNNLTSQLRLEGSSLWFGTKKES